MAAPDRPIPFTSAAYDKPGVYELAKGIFMDVMVPRGRKVHRHFRGSLPESDGIEDAFSMGPMLAIYSDSAVVDVQAGLTLSDGRGLRETAVVSKLIDHYGVASAEDLGKAQDVGDDRIIVPVASQRSDNFCRWWLDSVSKIFVCAQSSLLRGNLRGAAYSPTIPTPERRFQRQTLKALASVVRPRQEAGVRLLRCRSVNSPGLTFGGGQSLGGMVADFARFLEFAIPSEPTGERGGELVYLSRNDSSMRRILNEDDLVPHLTAMGFRTISASTLSTTEQIEAFRRARVVLSAHGAGLTNILFCRPETTIVEIFPDGGVHGSAFHRIASHLDFPYYHIVTERVETRQSAKNPVNADIRVDVGNVVAFLRKIIQ